MSKYKLSPIEVFECTLLYAWACEYNIGNPDDRPKFWWHYEEYEEYNDREECCYWETLIWELKQVGFPYALTNAVKYVTVAPLPKRYDKIFKLIHWLEDHPEYV